MKKNLYLFLLLAIIALGSCKKSCDFPRYMDGKYCTDIRESLIGYYSGLSYDTFAQGFRMAQDLTVNVSENNGGFINIIVYTLGGTLDASGNIAIPNQFCYVAQFEPYHASGIGFIGDTMVDGKANKYLTLRINYVADSSGNINFTQTFAGVR